MLIWWRSEQRILLRPGDLARGRFFRYTLGLAITPAEARDSAWARSMAAYAVAAGWDGLGARDAVPREVTTGRLERMRAGPGVRSGRCDASAVKLPGR